MNHPFAGNQIENSIFPQLRWGSLTTATTATTETATELRSELARSTTLLALTSVTASVTTLAVTTVATVATATAAESTSALTTTLLTHHATGRGMRPLLLDVGSGNDLGGEVEPLPEVVETLGGEGVVVVLPRELGLDVAARGQGLESLDDKEVANAGLVGRLIVLRSDHNTLTEEVLVDRLTVGLGNQHLGGLTGVDTVEGADVKVSRCRPELKIQI